MKSSGLLATFRNEENFVKALKALKREGFNHIDIAAPQDVEGLDTLMGRTERDSLYSRAGLAGAVFGILTGFLMQWYASVVQTPLDVGGRPLNSWPSFIPITYILMILCSALFLTVAFIVDLRLPWPSHPVFRTSMDLSSDCFAIIVNSQDPRFEAAQTRELLRRLKADQVEDIP